MMQFILFVLCSIPIVMISWKPLHDQRSHGFYRFFAWEGILALFVLNMLVWFREPFSWNQIISWILLIASLIPLAFGVYSLRTRGKPTQRRADDRSLLAFEKTSTLVTSGIYRYIRHPLYSSLLLLTWGIYFKAPSWIGFIVAAISTVFLVATAKADEAECINFFGSQYQEYMKHSKRFLPYVF